MQPKLFVTARRATLAALAVTATLSTSSAFADDEFPWLSERKIQGENNLEKISAAKGTDTYEQSRAIARVEKLDGYPYCTASRVGKNLFLTNYHCDQPCDTFQFTLGAEDGVTESERQIFRCKALVHKNEEYDYALYTVETYVPEGGADNESSYPVMTLWDGPIDVNQKVFVPSHPSGRLKEIDRSDECLLTSVEPVMTIAGRNTIKHMCDTEGGSSGSPVLDRGTGFAVALHWGGKDDEYNMAIPMSLILADMRAKVPADIYSQLSVQQ